MDLLIRCLRAVRRTTVTERPEIVLIDNGSMDPFLQRALRRWRERGRGVLLTRPGPFNFAALCNAGARVAAGEILVFLNNDVEPLHSGWLGELGWLLADERIGAASATLLYPDGTLQHVGLERDADGHWHHPYRFAPATSAGHNDELLQPHVVPAATAACLAITRERFLAVGGFDESLPVVGNDVDLCLRLARLGWLTVVTPAARLLHFESLTRGYAREAVA
jgi:GT2 family glycosyltransferase